MNKTSIAPVLTFFLFFTTAAIYPNASGSRGVIRIQADKQIGVVDPNTYGLFMEMCYFEFNGGIWAEMLKSRKFAENDGENKYSYGVVKPWFPIGRTEKTYFMHDNTIYYCGQQSQKIESDADPDQLCGIGQGQLYSDSTRKYLVRIHLKQKDIQGPVVVALEGKRGVYANQEIYPKDSNWNRYSFILKPAQTDSNGNFTISFRGKGILWIGSVSLMPEDNLSGFRRDVVEALREMGPANIRWPGGNTVSVYHWEDGIGDRDRRPPRFIRELWDPNDVGIDEFLELCHLVKTRPYLVVNAGDGTPEEAARWVEYCNGGLDTPYGKRRAENGHREPYNIRLWGIGNEMYGNWQNGHVDEETYALRHRTFAMSIRKVDKNIKIVASGARYWEFPRWNRMLLREAGDWLDYLALHSYAKKYRRSMKKEDLADPGFAETFYYYIVSAPYGIEEQIIETDKEIRKVLPDRPEIKIAFDEWNCWAYVAPFELVDFALRDGIYTAGVLHAFRRQHRAVTLANFSKVVNALSMIRVNPYGMFFNPQYLVFKMYKNHSGPQLLETAVQCDSFPAPEYEEGRPQAKKFIPCLDVSATRSTDGRTVFISVINLNLSDTVNTEIVLDGWKPRSMGKIVFLEGADFTTENTFGHPENIRIVEKVLESVKANFEYSFPPHSITILDLRKSDGPSMWK